MTPLWKPISSTLVRRVLSMFKKPTQHRQNNVKLSEKALAHSLRGKPLLLTDPPPPGRRLPPLPLPVQLWEGGEGGGPGGLAFVGGEGSWSEGLNPMEQHLSGGSREGGVVGAQEGPLFPQSPRGCPVGGRAPAHRCLGLWAQRQGCLPRPLQAGGRGRVPPQRLCRWEEGGLAGPRASPGLSLELKAAR